MVFGRWSRSCWLLRLAPTFSSEWGGHLCAPSAATIATWNPARTRCARSPPREPRGPSVWPWVSNRAHAPRGSASAAGTGSPTNAARRNSIASALAVRVSVPAVSALVIVTYGVGIPLLLAQASRVRRGDNHANNITQKARTLLTEDADAAFCIDRDACFGSCMLLRQQRPLRGALHSPHAAGAAREIVVAMPPREGRGGGAVADVADVSRMPKTHPRQANPL